MESRKQYEENNTDINVHIKYNNIRNIALNIGKNISDNYYGAISTIDKHAECGYYIVKCTSNIYTFQYYYKIGKYLTNTGELVWDVLYFNQLDNFNQ